MKRSILISKFIITIMILALLVMSVSGNILSESGNPDEKSHAIFSIDGATFDVDLSSLTKMSNSMSLESKIGTLNIPSTVQRYDVVSFDVNEISTSSKNSLNIVLYGEEHTLVLERLNFENIDDGIDSYIGYVEGIDDSMALFTFDESMNKEIIHGIIDVGDETLYITPVQTREDGLKTSYPLHIVYSSDDVRTTEQTESDYPTISRNMCLQPPILDSDDGGLTQSAQPLSSSSDWATVTVLVATDNEFYTTETNWVSSAQSYMSAAAAQYQRSDIEVYLNVVSYDDSKRNVLSGDSRKTTDPLGLFYEKFTEEYLESKNADIAIYLGGNDHVGTEQGSAWQYEYPKKAYNGRGWCQMVGDYTPIIIGALYDGSYNARIYCIIHEIGHMFNAHHELGLNEIDSDRTNKAYSWYSSTGMKYTVMWSSYTGDRNSVEYSSPSYHGDSTHDNAGAIRAVKHQIAAYR